MESLEAPSAAAVEETSDCGERRGAERFDCDGTAEVVVPTAGFLFRGEIRDISLSGCYIETRARLDLKRRADVEVRFTLAGCSFSVFARVMRVQRGKGAGFQFLFDDPKLERRLLDLIQRLSEMRHAQSSTPPSEAGAT